jgi:phytoene dehydrogenase-like protein
MHDERFDLIVAGGGIAGLAAATGAARAGLRTVVLERATEVGGVARSTERDGFALNLGPRALYPPAARLLDELGVAYPHGQPPLTGYALADGRLHAMPEGPVGLLRGALFDGQSAREASEALGALASSDAGAIARESLAGWVRGRGIGARARQFLYAIIRLAGYIDAPERLSAAAAQEQLAEAAGGVRYVDGGWRTIVAGLRSAAEGARAAIRTGARVAGVLRDERGITGVALADGTVLRAPSVVLAMNPEAARAIVAPAGGRIAATEPVRAAVLDVALARLPNPEGGFVLALDRPLYLSVHSVAARLAPAGGAVVHAARYLRPDEHPDAKEVRTELESLLDLVQPGWRAVVAFDRLLPDMTVTHALPSAEGGGFAGRPAVAVEGLPGAYVAGDWAGAEHQLAGAALASAKRAVKLATERRAAMLAGAEA